MNKKIEFTAVVLDDTLLKVVYDSTCFINHSKYKHVDIKDALKLHSEIVRHCKDNKIKLSYKNKFKATLKDLESEYKLAYVQYGELYDKLKNGWENKIVNGLYEGYIDDIEYLELRELYFNIQRLNSTDNIISKVNTIKYELDELIDDIRNGYSEFNMIVL